jgi:hypothetical protein
MLQLLTMAVHIQPHAGDVRQSSKAKDQQSDEESVGRGNSGQMVHLFRLKPGCASSSYAVRVLHLYLLLVLASI